MSTLESVEYILSAAGRGAFLAPPLPPAKAPSGPFWGHPPTWPSNWSLIVRFVTLLLGAARVASKSAPRLAAGSNLVESKNKVFLNFLPLGAAAELREKNSSLLLISFLLHLGLLLCASEHSVSLEREGEKSHPARWALGARQRVPSGGNWGQVCLVLPLELVSPAARRPACRPAPKQTLKIGSEMKTEENGQRGGVPLPARWRVPGRIELRAARTLCVA